MSAAGAPLFIDTGFAQCCHHAEKACGDAVAFRRIPAEERLIAVLADGLGHGLKANILALMTTTMALRFSAEDREIVHSAEIIMDALPVCQVRRISYATFTIVDTRLGGATSVVEMGNPEFQLYRGGKPLEVEGREFSSPKYRERTMTAYNFHAQPQDRLLFFSDGVTQAGLGSQRLPLGWRGSGVREYVTRTLAELPEISAHACRNLYRNGRRAGCCNFFRIWMAWKAFSLQNLCVSKRRNHDGIGVKKYGRAGPGGDKAFPFFGKAGPAQPHGLQAQRRAHGPASGRRVYPQLYGPGDCGPGKGAAEQLSPVKLHKSAQCYLAKGTKFAQFAEKMLTDC